MPYRVSAYVTRLSGDHDDQPMICRLSLFRLMAHGRFILLHEHRDIGEMNRLGVSQLQGVALDVAQNPSIHGENCSIFLAGQTHMYCHALTANYQTLLAVGEKYHLLWPGGEIEAWDWVEPFGEDDDSDQEFKPLAVQKTVLPRLVLPPAAGIVFTAVAPDEPFPDREQYIECEGPHVDYDCANEMEYDWRMQQERLRDAEARGPTPELPGISPSDRVANAPVLFFEIVWAGQDGSSTETVSKVTYLATSATADNPITFHTWAFPRNGCQLWRWLETEARWEEHDESHVSFCYEDEVEDSPDVEVKVGKSDSFVSLWLGESWTQTSSHLKPRAGVAKPGDRFKFVAKGTIVDWWDWGTKEDHLETIVIVPSCWPGRVQNPVDNNGRPRIVVPESNAVEFVWE